MFAITDHLRKARAIEQQMGLTFNAQGMATPSGGTTMGRHGTQRIGAAEHV